MKITTTRVVNGDGWGMPASDLFCTAADCENDAAMAVLVDGEFQGDAYCRRRGHRAEVLTDAQPQAREGL